MPYNDPDPTDPNILVGVVLPADAEAMREMAYAFAEEFVRMGYDKGKLLNVFQNPFYAGAHGAYRTLGEQNIRAIIDECINVWGRSKIAVQEAQHVQDGSTPSFILPRVAGEERGGGLNDLNALNVR